MKDGTHTRYEMPVGEKPLQIQNGNTFESKDTWIVEHPEVDLNKGRIVVTLKTLFA